MLKPIAVIVALTLAPTAFAQTYIVPDGDCGAVTLHATRGDFPNLGEAVAADRVTLARVYMPRQRLTVTPVAGAHSVDLAANVPDTGVVMAAVDFAPAINGNETRTEHAKAFVRCGAIARGDDWQRTTGIGLEIYPQWNGLMPLKPGDSMRFIAVDASTKKLLRDVPMKLVRAGSTEAIGGTPDPNGGMTFPYKQPGRYMVTTTYRRPDPQQPGLWLVDTSTLTFEMK
jgi:hypothetical protein